MIDIIGGTYFERCREPAWNFLYGSGLRAAIQLRAFGIKVRLHTAIGGSEQKLLTTITASHGISVDDRKVSKTIEFRYEHGLATPDVFPDPRRDDYSNARPMVNVTTTDLLCFGLLEADISAKARRVVYDPQSPTRPIPFRSFGSADELVVIANAKEIQLMGKGPDIEHCCRNILLSQHASAVVAKLGTSGCLVVQKAGSTRVPAFRTERVFPIGSGDIFSAAYTASWMASGTSPVIAARFASKAAATYVSMRQPPHRRDIKSATLAPLSLLPQRRHHRVYLAGPFFNLGQRWVIEEARRALIGAGVHVFSPLHDVGHGLASDVYRPDIDGLKSCGVVLACLDGLDPGTLYEIGYAHALGLEVIVFVGPEREEDLKMIHGGGSTVVDDFSSAIYLTTWAATCR